MFFDFNVFWRENDVTRLTAKLKFQDMANQVNNIKRAGSDRIKCEKKNLKIALGLRVIKF